ncbi:MAG: YvcK family protein [Fimbriimonadales bacterium]|nr:YvcK family protein [Fimbriimonadales bacterium]
MISRYRLRKLLAPTAGFRRALVATLLGLASFLAGTALSFRAVLLPVLDILSRAATSLVGRFVPPDSREMATHLLGGAFLLLGFYLMFLGARLALRHLIATLNPKMRSPMAEVYWRRQQRDQGPNIVALGGGTGLSTLLRGLKQHSSNITAIVTVTDDGGSSGRLSQDFGILPPGDLRNCLVALAEAEQAMTDLFQYRFTEQGSFSGHSLGNVLIYALTRQAGGDFERALEIASEVLNISGRVMPSTLDRVRLRAIVEDGSQIVGETAIVDARKRIRRIFLDPEEVRPFEQALEAIAEADLICIGPGSVYTSVIPNLLVPGIAKAIRQSKAVKAYICNVMTQPGESDSFTASEHVIAIQANVEGRLFDYVVTNVARPSQALLRKYESSNQHFVEPDIDRIRSLGFKVITGDFMNETDVVRHDPFRVAAKLMRLVEG